MGELKIELIPAAVPQPTSTGTYDRAIENARPKPDAIAAPICTIGPPAPADPPGPLGARAPGPGGPPRVRIVTALVSRLSTAASGRNQPLARVTVSITSTTPCPAPPPRRWKHQLAPPTMSPPSAGKNRS